jgi:hypothetical protein
MGGYAPLWAGVMLAGGYPWGEPDAGLSHKAFVAGFFSTIHTPERLANALSYSLALAEFVTTFVPARSGRLVLPPERLMRFETDVEASLPPLTPLTEKERIKALLHKPIGWDVNQARPKA